MLAPLVWSWQLFGIYSLSATAVMPKIFLFSSVTGLFHSLLGKKKNRIITSLITTTKKIKKAL
jgi:hypothetical protein